jgi:arabinan endo-1,5-alpha-L-arabinosidase
VSAARALLLCLALAACAPKPSGVASQAAGTNPVLDADFPDPAVLRASDGFYYAYATQSERDGRMINIQVARSRDLRRWDHLGDALPAKPAWAAKTQDFWAPHVAEHGGRYILYYSAKPDAALEDKARGLCLAVATAAKPEGPFTDIGAPLLCGEGFVNIDPMAFTDPKTGKHLLYWGSGFGPIKVRELGGDSISFAHGTPTTDLVPVVKTDDPANYQRLVEGAWVHYRAPYYYLFYSGDNCCGPNAHYAVMVARSRSATGPFETLEAATGRKSSVILEQHGLWVAPGHNSVATDAQGRDWILYHAVDSRRPRTKESDDINSRRVMLVDRIVWEGGWPRISGIPAPLSGAAPTRRP